MCCNFWKKLSTPLQWCYWVLTLGQMLKRSFARSGTNEAHESAAIRFGCTSNFGDEIQHLSTRFIMGVTNSEFESDRFTQQLRQQHHQDLRSELETRHNELQFVDLKRYSIVDLFRKYAILHQIAFSVEIGPQCDPDLQTRALVYAYGKHACTILGVLTFAALAVASLELPISTSAVFLTSAAVGYLLSLVVNSGVALATKAGPANPKAETDLRRLASIAGAGVFASAAAFMLLRFMSATAQSYVSIVLVTFEASIFVLGGALGGGQLVCSWSGQLAGDYEALNKHRNEMLRRLHAIDAELDPGARATGNSTPQQGSEVKHEDDRTKLMPSSPAIGSSYGSSRQGVNGVDRS